MQVHVGHETLRVTVEKLLLLRIAYSEKSEGAACEIFNGNMWDSTRVFINNFPRVGTPQGVVSPGSPQISSTSEPTTPCLLTPSLYRSRSSHTSTIHNDARLYSLHLLWRLFGRAYSIHHCDVLIVTQVGPRHHTHHYNCESRPSTIQRGAQS